MTRRGWFIWGAQAVVGYGSIMAIAWFFALGLIDECWSPACWIRRAP